MQWTILLDSDLSKFKNHGSPWWDLLILVGHSEDGSCRWMCFYVPGLRGGKENERKGDTWTTLSGSFIISQTYPSAWSTKDEWTGFWERISFSLVNAWKEDFIFWWKALWKYPPQITCLTTYRFKCVNILFCILNKCYIMGANLYYTVYGIIKKLFHYFLSQ